jgi:transcriptional regulator with XRE-family HTH domain
MTGPSRASALGAHLKTERRKRRLSLRDLADETGISVNTLSRVERGYLPDLKNYQKITDWLGLPADTFLDSSEGQSPLDTPDVIARHLHSDTRLGPAAAAKIAAMVQDMYRSLAAERPAVAVHLRSARTFKPEAGTLLARMLTEMQEALLAESNS